jgi:hypothetical protein
MLVLEVFVYCGVQALLASQAKPDLQRFSKTGFGFPYISVVLIG